MINLLTKIHMPGKLCCILTLALVLIAMQGVAGASEWAFAYGGSDYDRANSIQQTSDGGYIVAGGTWSFDSGNGDAESENIDYHPLMHMYGTDTSLKAILTSQPQPSIPYFNLTQGTRLIYIWNNTLHHPDPITENVTLTEVGVEPWGEINYFFDFNNDLANSRRAFGHYAIALDNGFFENRGSHSSVHGSLSIPIPPMHFGGSYYTSPSMIFPANASIGYSWSGEGKRYRYSVNYTSFIESFESITTPAGTFYCAKVVTNIESDHSYINGTRTMWIGEPGVVKLIYNHSDGSTTYVELADITQITLPLDIQEVSVSPSNGFVDVTLTWSGDGQIRLDFINSTTLDTVNISGSGTQTFTLTLPSDSLSDYYFIHIVDISGYYHFEYMVYIESTPPSNQPPVANFTFSPSSPTVGQTITFDASSSYDPDGTITSYQWVFGDGTTASGVTVQHSYSSAGTYTVTLTVTDDDGLQASISKQLSVSAGETAPDNVDDTKEQIVSKYNPSFDWRTETPSKQDVMQAVVNAVIQYFSTSDQAARQGIVSDVIQLVGLYFSL